MATKTVMEIDSGTVRRPSVRNRQIWKHGSRAAKFRSLKRRFAEVRQNTRANGRTTCC